MNIQGTWCSIRRLSRNHWNGWRCLHQFLDHWILRRWWNLNQHLSASALCREILDVVAAIHVLAQTHCAVAQSAGMGGKWVLVSLGPLILTWIIFNFIGSFGSIHWSSSNASSSISSSSKHASPSLSVSSSLTSSPKWRGQRMSRVIYTRENLLSLATPSLMY